MGRKKKLRSQCQVPQGESEMEMVVRQGQMACDMNVWQTGKHVGAAYVSSAQYSLRAEDEGEKSSSIINQNDSSASFLLLDYEFLI